MKSQVRNPDLAFNEPPVDSAADGRNVGDGLPVNGHCFSARKNPALKEEEDEEGG